MSRLHDMGGRFGNGPIPLHKNENNKVEDKFEYLNKKAGEIAQKAKESGYYPPIIVPKALEIGPRLLNTFTTAYKFGIKIAFGTDSGVSYHGDNAKEFIYMVKGGMLEMEAIRSATVVTAELLKVSDKFGTVESNKIADIIAVDGDPVKDISCLQKVVFVMKDGKIYKQPG